MLTYRHPRLPRWWYLYKLFLQIWRWKTRQACGRKSRKSPQRERKRVTSVEITCSACTIVFLGPWECALWPRYHNSYNTHRRCCWRQGAALLIVVHVRVASLFKKEGIFSPKEGGPFFFFGISLNFLHRKNFSGRVPPQNGLPENSFLLEKWRYPKTIHNLFPFLALPLLHFDPPLPTSNTVIEKG